jgi:competence protein ComEC
MLSILFPDREAGSLDTNVSSVISRLTYGESEFLFTGDSPLGVEDYLASLGGIESDVLKVGHHGSKTSTGAAFVAAVSPRCAVISVGKDKRYGHPNPEVLEILESFGTDVLRTDQLGRIVFKTDGNTLKLAGR